jgi:hypothetical protein
MSLTEIAVCGRHGGLPLRRRGEVLRQALSGPNNVPGWRAKRQRLGIGLNRTVTKATDTADGRPQWPSALERAMFAAMEKHATELKPAAGETQGESLDAGGVRLAWGDPTRWKAQWREESLRQHLNLPVGERLRRALSLLLKRSGT